AGRVGACPDLHPPPVRTIPRSRGRDQDGGGSALTAQDGRDRGFATICRCRSHAFGVRSRHDQRMCHFQVSGALSSSAVGATGADVPVQYFQSIIAIELAVAGALLFQVRYFDRDAAAGSTSDPWIRLFMAIVLAATPLARCAAQW